MGYIVVARAAGRKRYGRACQSALPSGTVSQRPTNRLVTLIFSHYNEKARWALDHCGIEYEERAFMPGFSQLGVLVATRGRGGRRDSVSTRWSTPVLLTQDGETLFDSTDIAQWAAARARSNGADPLFPVPEVLDLVVALGTDLGPQTRLVGYWHALQQKALLGTVASRNVSRRQALAFRVFAPLGSVLIARQLGVNDEGYRRSMTQIRALLAKIEERLTRGPYLVGDTFTAADLTFASLMAPILLVSREEGYGASFPSLDEIGPGAREVVDEMRARPAGAFALEMFRRHRRRV
jgi:glutathione S-transferase